MSKCLLGFSKNAQTFGKTKELHPSLMTWKLSHDIVSKCKLDFHFPSASEERRAEKKSRQDKVEKSFQNSEFRNLKQF